MYARTTFRGAKTCKIGRKGCVFGHMTNFGRKKEGQIKEKRKQKRVFGVVFSYLKNMCLGCVLKALLRG